ncbi:MAG: M42 family metallopeptidase [Bacilli bacterium]|nr:M42 family metallopeptidase [Bacilli bacterium]
MELNYKLLEQIINIDSPTGYCSKVINYLETVVKELGFNYTKNQKGNLIVSVEGKSDYTVGLSAHVDTLGLMVRSINGDGTLKFTTLGGPLLNTYNAEYCKIYTREGKIYTGTILSTSPAVHVFPDSRSKDLKEDTMCVRLDEVVYSRSDTQKLGIQTGDIIAIDPKFEITPSGYVKTRFLDDKASAFLLLELLRYLKEQNITPENNLKLIFSTYEEVGFGASNIPNINEMLAVDMGCIGLDLNCTEEQVSICAKDSGGPYDYDMTSKLIELAKANNISYAVDIYPFYSSDATASLRAGNDIKAALIGTGVAASHGMERTHKHGLENTFNLILGYLNI